MSDEVIVPDDADKAMADAIRDGHMEENPNDPSEVRITQAGLSRYLILSLPAEAFFAAQRAEDPTGESPVEPPELDIEPDARPLDEVIEVDDAPPPTEPT